MTMTTTGPALRVKHSLTAAGTAENNSFGSSIDAPRLVHCGRRGGTSCHRGCARTVRRGRGRGSNGSPRPRGAGGHRDARCDAGARGAGHGPLVVGRGTAATQPVAHPARGTRRTAGRDGAEDWPRAGLALHPRLHGLPQRAADRRHPTQQLGFPRRRQPVLGNGRFLLDRAHRTAEGPGLGAVRERCDRRHRQCADRDPEPRGRGFHAARRAALRRCREFDGRARRGDLERRATARDRRLYLARLRRSRGRSRRRRATEDQLQRGRREPARRVRLVRRKHSSCSATST